MAEESNGAERRDDAHEASAGDATGRTMMDVVHGQLTFMQRAWPRLWPVLLIVACGLLMWITLKDADADARREVQAELDAARERLTSTYLKISEMTDRQLAGIDRLMKLEDEVEKKVADAERARSEAEKTRANAEASAADAREEQVRAESARNEAQTKLEEAETKLEEVSERAERLVDREVQLRSQFAEAQQELGQKQVELQEVSAQIIARQAQLQEGTGELDRVRNDLLELIRVTVTDTTLIETDAQKMALEYKRTYKLNDQNQIDLLQRLRAFGEEPGPETASAMLQLIGLDKSRLKKAIGQLRDDSATRDLYAYWGLILDQDNFTRELYVGVGRMTDTTCLNVLVFIVDHDKVTAVSRLDKVFAVATRDPHEWSQSTAFLIARTFEGKLDRSLHPYQIERVGDTWSITEIVEQESGMGVERMAGQWKPLRYVSLESFGQSDPALYEAAERSKSELAAAIDLAQRAASFDPNEVSGLSAVPADLADARARFIELLREIVAGERKAVGELAAAQILEPSFRVESAARLVTRALQDRCEFVCFARRRPIKVVLEQRRGGGWEPLGSRF